MKQFFSNLSNKSKVIMGATVSLISASVVGLGIGFGIDFKTEKGHLWNLIQETPKDTAHVVFINGFVGTTIVTKYLNEVAKDKFTVGVIRGYMSSGKLKDEDQTYKKYSNLEFYNAPSKSTHMKSYFWFNKEKQMIRSLTGSGNFSESAIFKVPSYKEVLYDITNYEGVGRDLFCGGTSVSQIDKTTVNARPKTIESLYNSNCSGFSLNDKNTYLSGETITANKQFKKIVEAHKVNPQLKTAKGLIVLTGDGETQVMNKYLEETNDEKMNLDVFIGNTSAGFKPDEEVKLIKDYKERLQIIREHPKLTKGKDDKDLISNGVAKTHTKIYVWYDENYRIIGFLSGSANFSNNGVDFSEKNQPFREVLIDIKLDKDWKNKLVCKVINAFKTKPSSRMKAFCGSN